MTSVYARALAAIHKPTPIPAPVVVETADGDHSGIMVALMLPTEVALDLAVPDGEPARDLHITLTYNAASEEEFGGIEKTILLLDVVQAWARTVREPLTGMISGPGYFLAGEQPVSVLLPDLPGLPDARTGLLAALRGAGLGFMDNHGYTPHITINYGAPLPVASFASDAGKPLVFDRVTVVVGGTRMSYAFGTGEYLPEEQDTPLAGEYARAYTTPREEVAFAPPVSVSAAQQATRAFTTEHNGRIMVTAPASVGLGTGLDWVTTKRIIEGNPADNMWIVGRLVGGDSPNRNGALWSAADLAAATPTVALGPLNWLHDRSKIIGAIAEAQFVPADPTRTGLGEIPDPHIIALSTIWPYCNPQMTQVVMEASAQGCLWYSMECRAEEIRCTGPGGCGAVYPYTQYQSDPMSVCLHLQNRTSVRQLIHPYFRGAAVIVPPSRPGWADADAMTVTAVTDDTATLDEAAAAAYAEAGNPDISTSDWAGIVAEVRRVAETR